MLRIGPEAFPTRRQLLDVRANFKVQPDAKNVFRPRLNFSNPPRAKTRLILQMDLTTNEESAPCTTLESADYDSLKRLICPQ